MFTAVHVESRPFPTTPALPETRSIGDLSDAELVRALLDDEPRAWREFNTRFSRLILSTISRVTTRFRGVVSQEDVREIYATFAVQLLANDKNKLRSFDPERGNKLSTWLGLLASHTAYDFLRSARREPKRAALSEAEDLYSALPDPCESALMRERASLVGRLLADFTAKDRAFIQLYFGEGLAPERVAERLGISVKTVYSKKHKIQARLQALLVQAQVAA
ncbi:MAG TPA: sigma-70 family RNA polymerase sigma factor [Polyangiaceae bacterium]|jgi:RNA polymerase sigma-70 factor (ECF subfamily)|nr:sigma-70 family RNA polymerase sigma factor [Polyangiaceae bacterium]